MTKVTQVYAPLPSVTRGKPVHIGYNDHNKMGTHIVYPTGNCIVIKNVNNPLDTDIYYEHTSETTCAKYSPSGYYICSGDVQGNVRIWDTTQKEHPLKFSFKALSGPIYDIAWTGDSQRICVVGEGKEKLGSVFMWDAGSSVGEISGQTKTLLSCDFRGTRPFRLITTGEDNYPCWFEGPPFKFKKSMKDIHSRFINCGRFSPDGSLCVCVSSDKSISVFDGKLSFYILSFLLLFFLHLHLLFTFYYSFISFILFFFNYLLFFVAMIRYI
ncbi:66 kda stress protein putative [Entamoeba histolytica]|uniref:66 kDa stress protein putative n=1 Tax=Entamoeba histolytica TaxID=5759 RepID=A0A175K009_ENTHI|nr:66 kda stress protein putative [Entamoeba histolytica]